MGRNQGNRDLTDLQKGGVLALKTYTNLSNRQTAKLQHCSEKSVRNVHRVAYEAEKENRDPMDPLIHIKKPRSGRPYILNDRDARRMIRYVIKNKANRRKPWVDIVREYGYFAKISIINNCFFRHGYGRYPPRFKPPLSPEMKAQYLRFSEEWLEKLRGKEHQVIYTDEISVRVRETRG